MHRLCAVALTFCGYAAPVIAADAVLVGEGEIWRYFEGLTPPSQPQSVWRQPAFDDRHWLSGPTGIGIEDGDDATVVTPPQGRYTTIFARKAFEVPDPEQVDGLFLRIAYDDGFIAFLNGREAARSPNMGDPGVELGFDGVALASHEALDAEEFPIDSALLWRGRNVLAIQLHNASLVSDDLSLVPSLHASPCSEAFTGIACTFDAERNQVTVAWKPGNFDSYRVTRNGVEITGSPFPAGTSNAVDGAPGSSDNLYEVTAMAAGRECQEQSCVSWCSQRESNPLRAEARREGALTRIELSWPRRPEAAVVRVFRDSVQAAELAPETARFIEEIDPWARAALFYRVDFLYADGAACQFSIEVPLCPRNVTCELVDGPGRRGVDLAWSNMVRPWAGVSVQRSHGGEPFVTLATLGDGATGYFDEDAPALEPGQLLVYGLLFSPRPGEELPPACGLRCELVLPPEEPARFNAPAGGWDWRADFSPGDDRYVAEPMVSGNLDGRWIRAGDDQWDGSGPAEIGIAPGGPAPGGIAVAMAPADPRDGAACAHAEAGVLRLVDPGNPGNPTGALAEAHPHRYDAPNNSRLVLGLDLGAADRNFLREGATFAARWRLSPEPLDFVAAPGGGGGGGFAGGLGQVGIAHVSAAGDAAGLSFTLQRDGQLRASVDNGFIFFGAETTRFMTLWATVVDADGDGRYAVNVYLNGDTSSLSHFPRRAGQGLSAPEVDFGSPRGNYLVIALSDVEGNADVEIDWIAMKRGVHLPSSEPCADPHFLRGDCNGDGATGGVADAIYHLRFNFLGGAAPGCPAACDADGDGGLGGVTDALYVLQGNFLGGPAPPPPHPLCGPASLESDAVLGCGQPPDACRR